MITLLRDVLVIPERAGAEDCVLRLTDSVGTASAARTRDNYVVTPALAEAFGAAMGLVAESITSGVAAGVTRTAVRTGGRQPTSGRGAYMMTATPTRQTSAPVTS